MLDLTMVRIGSGTLLTRYSNFGLLHNLDSCALSVLHRTRSYKHSNTFSNHNASFPEALSGTFLPISKTDFEPTTKPPAEHHNKMAYLTHEKLAYCSQAFTEPTLPTSSSSSTHSTISSTSTATSAYHEQQVFEQLYSTPHAQLIRREFGEAAYQVELLRLEACALEKQHAKNARQSKWLGVQLACQAEKRSVVRGWMKLKAAVEIMYTMRAE